MVISVLTRDNFAALYAEQAERLRVWTRHMLRESYRRADADGEACDLTEDVWARLWELWPTFAELPTTGYLFNAVRHGMIDAYRRGRILSWLSLDATPSEQERGEPGRWLCDPRDRYEQLETRLDLAAALGLLTPTERRAFVAFHVLDGIGGNLNGGQQKMARLRARRRLQRCEPLALYASAS